MRIWRRLSVWGIAVLMLLMTCEVLATGSFDADLLSVTLDETITFSFGQPTVAVNLSGNTIVKVDLLASTDREGADFFDMSSMQLYLRFTPEVLSYSSCKQNVPAREDPEDPDADPISMNVGDWGGVNKTRGNEKGYCSVYLADPGNLCHAIPNHSAIATLTFTVKEDAPQDITPIIQFGVHEDLGNVKNFALKGYPAEMGRETDSYPVVSGDAITLNQTHDLCALQYADGTLVFQRGYKPESGRTVSAVYTVNETAGYGDDSIPPWNAARDTTHTVVFQDTMKPTSTSYWFFGFKSLKNINRLENLDTSDVVDMNDMFSDCDKLTSLNLSSFDTSHVTNMERMFNGCSSLSDLDLSSFNTSNVTYMDGMFSGCSSLTYLELSSFDTSSVTDMRQMFCNAVNLKTICTSSHFSTASLTDDGIDMFFGCSSLKGSNGTEYTADYTDKTYARMDNPPSAPGYFSQSSLIGTFDADRDTYSFGNTMDAFGYTSLGSGSDYPISASVFQLILGNNLLAKNIYKREIRTLWSGNCAGMSGSVDLFFADNGISPQDFGKPNVSSLSIEDLNTSFHPPLSAKTFIEAMQIAQYTEAFTKERKEHQIDAVSIAAGKTLDALYQYVVSDWQNGKGTLLAIVKDGVGGHALLATGPENPVPDQEASSVRLKVYDCNFPGETRYFTLYRNSSGALTGWSYDMGGNLGVWSLREGGASDCTVSYVTHDTLSQIWANRGNQKKDYEVLTVNMDNCSILNFLSQEVARLVNGRLVTNQADIFGLPALSMNWSKEQTIFLPRDCYTITSTDGGTLSACITDQNLMASVSTTSSSITFAVDDTSNINEVRLHGATEEDTYTIWMESGHPGVRYETVEISGSGSSFNGEADSGIRASISGDKLTTPDSMLSLFINGIEYCGDELYELNEVTLNDNDSVTVSLSNSAPAIVLAAFYNMDGRYLGLSSASAAADCGSVTLPAPDLAETFPAQYRVRVMLVDKQSRCRVLCPSRVKEKS